LLLTQFYGILASKNKRFLVKKLANLSKQGFILCYNNASLGELLMSLDNNDSLEELSMSLKNNAFPAELSISLDNNVLQESCQCLLTIMLSWRAVNVS